MANQNNIVVAINIHRMVAYDKKINFTASGLNAILI